MQICPSTTKASTTMLACGPKLSPVTWNSRGHRDHSQKKLWSKSVWGKMHELGAKRIDSNFSSDTKSQSSYLISLSLSGVYEMKWSYNRILYLTYLVTHFPLFILCHFWGVCRDLSYKPVVLGAIPGWVLKRHSWQCLRNHVMLVIKAELITSNTSSLNPVLSHF